MGKKVICSKKKQHRRDEMRALVGEEIRLTVRYEGFPAGVDMFDVLIRDPVTHAYQLRGRVMNIPINYAEKIDVDRKHVSLNFSQNSRLGELRYWRGLVAESQPSPGTRKLTI